MPAASGAGTGGGDPDDAGLPALREAIEADIRQLDEETSEMEMLVEQTGAELERYESRRSKTEQQLAQLETTAGTDPSDVAEARDSLMAVTRRQLLYDAQRQVLEGKRGILARYRARLSDIDKRLASLAGERAVAGSSSGPEPGMAGRTTTDSQQPIQALRDREELRRDIVRRLHDGPAQSIANIGLQAEIVERLVEKEDPRATEEIGRLRTLVQQALDTTKAFIFEIRPMVLDDLGLGPTIRRAASDRARRAGINVDFESRGIEERLDPDIESVVYRSVEEAIAAYLALKPPSVLVRMEWSTHELLSSVEATWPRHSSRGEAADQDAARGDAETPPALLAMMEEKRTAEREADIAARSLPPERVAEIEGRARALGLRLTIREDGQVMELVAPITR